VILLVSILDAIRTSSLGSDGLVRLNSRSAQHLSEVVMRPVMHLVPTNAPKRRGTDGIKDRHKGRITLPPDWVSSTTLSATSRQAWASKK